ncbi:MAG: hypothetical protein ABSC11_12670 [Smithella sp.]|jgi:hypothetical protein
MEFSALLISLVIIIASAADAVSESLPRQSQESFEAAIHNHSTAPPYVLITVVDASTESARSICTTVNLLMGALHLEYGIGFDKAGVSKVEEIALSNKSHKFRFTKQKAIDHIPVYYTDSDLAEIRAKLAPLSTEQIRAGFAEGKLHLLYTGIKSLKSHNAYRDATACVLIERGLSPGKGCRTDRLWLAP